MHRIAAEIAVEVDVLLKNGDLYARAGEQIPQHDPCGTSANDATGCLRWFDRHGLTPPIPRQIGGEPKGFNRIIKIIARARKIRPPIRGRDYGRRPSSCRDPYVLAVAPPSARRPPARRT